MIDSKLIETLSAPEESERRYAAEEISESGDPKAATVLVSQLHKESSRAVKEAILRGLSRIWTSNPVDSIIELLKDGDPFVRAEAADMLRRRAGDVIEGLDHLMRSDVTKICANSASTFCAKLPSALPTSFTSQP